MTDPIVISLRYFRTKGLRLVGTIFEEGLWILRAITFAAHKKINRSPRELIENANGGNLE